MSIIAAALKKAQEASQITRRAEKPARKEPVTVKEPAVRKEPAARKKAEARKFPRIRKWNINFRLPQIPGYAWALVAVSVLFFGALLFYLSCLSPVPVEEPAFSEAESESPSYVVLPEVKRVEKPPSPAYSPVTLADVRESIKLNGIMYTAEKPLAVINNNVWGEDDRVGGFKILKIGRDFIKIASSAGQEFVIKLKR